VALVASAPCTLEYPSILSRNAIRFQTAPLEDQMQRTNLSVIVALLAFVFLPSQAFAQEQSPSTTFEQKTYVYEPWIKGKFSEVVTVKNPGKWIFLAGIGPESEGDGKILFPGDFYQQCKYAYYRIKKLLALHGATLKNVVFVTTYMVDIRHIGASGKCRTEEFGEAGAELPPGASVGVNAFAWPDMLLEIAATAAVEK
jgi:enamine deaminase RidA (YjgF/YER057c/UK114 family)